MRSVIIQGNYKGGNMRTIQVWDYQYEELRKIAGEHESLESDSDVIGHLLMIYRDKFKNFVLDGEEVERLERLSLGLGIRHIKKWLTLIVMGLITTNLFFKMLVGI